VRCFFSVALRASLLRRRPQATPVLKRTARPLVFDVLVSVGRACLQWHIGVVIQDGDGTTGRLHGGVIRNRHHTVRDRLLRVHRNRHRHQIAVAMADIVKFTRLT
jgi:hypothetical protein